MGKKVQINSTNCIRCTKLAKYLSVLECIKCEDCFGKTEGYILCKRGGSKDVYLKKKERQDKGTRHATTKFK